MSATRVAVVGAGLIGQRHAALVAGSPAARLAAVVDPASAGAEVADRHGVPHVEDLGSPTMPELDAVIVATPNVLHVPVTLQAVELGLPTLVEKPVAESVAEADRLVTAAEHHRVPVLVGHHRRHSPTLAAAREVIARGELGQVVAVRGGAVLRKPDDYFDAAPWRRTAGGGPVLVNLVHELDALRWLLGEIAEVQALTSSAARGFEVEDTVAVTLRFRSGVLGTFLLSDAAASACSWELTSGEDPAYPHHPEQNCYEVAGSQGALSVPTLTLWRYDQTPSWWEPMSSRRLVAAPADPLARQLDHFLAVARGEVPPLVSAREATATLAATLAVSEAARTGETALLTRADGGGTQWSP